MDFFPGLPQPAVLQFKLQSANPKDGDLGYAVDTGSPKNGAQPRDQFAKPERLSYVVIRPSFQRKDLVILRVAYREHYDADPWRGGANPAACLHSPCTGHVDIQQHDIHGPLPNIFERVSCISSYIHVISTGPE
jgi:hypothetical protein